MTDRFGCLRGLTFLEIMVAVSIMAIAMLPLFSMISKGTTETDITASQAFALNKATETLNAILDNVPFEALRRGNPGFLRVDDLVGVREYDKFDETWCRKIAEMLFPGSVKDSQGYPCLGVVTDPRGIGYRLWLRIEDVAAAPAPANAQPENMQIGSVFDGEDQNKTPTDFPAKNELTFSFLKNPGVLSHPNFLENYKMFRGSTVPNPAKPRWEIECRGSNQNDVCESPVNVYLDQPPPGGVLPADAPTYANPTAARYTQRMACEKVNYDAPDEFAFCTLKKLVVEVQWNLEPALFAKPETTSPQTQRVHLMTIKGDITR